MATSSLGFDGTGSASRSWPRNAAPLRRFDESNAAVVSSRASRGQSRGGGPCVSLSLPRRRESRTRREPGERPAEKLRKGAKARADRRPADDRPLAQHRKPAAQTGTGPSSAPPSIL